MPKKMLVIINVLLAALHVLLIMTPVLECHGGFVRNSDYICIPEIIGLEARSLAILFISLIFYIVGCIQVNKARKWKDDLLYTYISNSLLSIIKFLRILWQFTLFSYD